MQTKDLVWVCVCVILIQQLDVNCLQMDFFVRRYCLLKLFLGNMTIQPLTLPNNEYITSNYNIFSAKQNIASYPLNANVAD